MLHVDMKVGKNEIVEANCTINDACIVVMGDERFYEMIGDNSLYSVNRLIYPDDVAQFEKFRLSDDTKEKIYVRLKIKTGSYRWILMEKDRVSLSADNERLVELRLKDMLVICSKFDLYYNNVRKYRRLISLIKEKIFEYDFNTNMLTIYCYVNNRAEVIEKDDIDEWIKRVIRLGWIEAEDIPVFNKLCDNIKTGTESFSVSVHTSFMSKGSRQDLLNFSGQTIVEGSSKVMVIGIASEISGRVNDKGVLYLASEVNKDSSTGLLNKKAITEEVTRSIASAKDEGDDRPRYLVILDIDNFKEVNDTYGHYFGDEVISEFANSISRTVGARGLVGRIGGDEFMIYLDDVDSIDTVKIMLKTIRNGLKVTLQNKKSDYSFSTSIGISTYGKDGDDYETLFKIADGCLYIAKEKGKDRYIIYDYDKHGNILNDDVKQHKHFNGADFMNASDKYDFAADMIMKICNEGGKSFVPAIYELMDRMNIHGISVYSGPDLKCKYTAGHYEQMPCDAAYIADEKCHKFYDEHGINKINNVDSLVVDYPEIYDLLKENNICSTLQFLKKDDDGNILAMMQFDTFGVNRRKWSQDDVTVVYMIVKALFSVINDELYK